MHCMCDNHFSDLYKTTVRNSLCLSVTNDSDTTMKFSAEQRQRILQQCSLHDRFNGLCAVSRRWGLSPDGKTLQRWFRQWDGTVESLKERSRSGRPRLLTAAQVHNRILQPVVAANRAHRCINYASVHPALQQNENVRVSLRTVRRYGRVATGIKNRRTQRKTAHEGKHTRIA